MKNKILTILLIAASVLRGATYYVATGGNNAANGDFLHPWLTINHALSTVVAGDTCFVRGDSAMSNGGYFGRYAIGSRLTSFDEPGRASIEFTNNGTAGNPIVCMAYPGDSIELKRTMDGNVGSGYLNAIIGFYNNQYCVVNGFTIYTYIDTIIVTGFNCLSSRHCRFEHCNVYGINRYPYILSDANLKGSCGYYNHSGIRFEASHNCKITDCVANGFICSTGPGDCNVNSNCILFYSDTACTVSYCYTDNGCETIRDKAFGTHQNAFINNIVVGNGPSQDAGVSIAQHPQSYTVVKNNLLINGLIFGIANTASSHEYNIIANNTIYVPSNTNLRGSAGLVQIGEGYKSATGNEFYNNLIYNNAASRYSIHQAFYPAQLWHTDTNLFDFCNYNYYKRFQIYLDLPTDDVSTSFATWQNRFGNDINGAVITESPFINEVDSFQLKADSPLRNAGRYGLHIGAYSSDEARVGPRPTGYVPPDPPAPAINYADSTGYKYIFAPNKNKIRIESKSGSPPMKYIVYNKYGSAVDSTETNDSLVTNGAGLYLIISKTR